MKPFVVRPNLTVPTFSSGSSFPKPRSCQHHVPGSFHAWALCNTTNRYSPNFNSHRFINFNLSSGSIKLGFCKTSSIHAWDDLRQATEKAKEDVRRAMDVLNKHLLTRTYLAGERITLADISVCCNLLQLYQWVSCNRNCCCGTVMSIGNCVVTSRCCFVFSGNGRRIPSALPERQPLVHDPRQSSQL